MRVTGEWLLFDDGVTRPIVRAKVVGADGTLHNERFLIDTGADRSVFCADLLGKLHWLGNHAAPGFALQGIGGSSPFVIGAAVIELTRDDGGPARISGPFAAFTNAHAADLSILGRDVLDNFDVIVSRRRSEVVLLAGPHEYQITAA
jgi:hypothetical protein